MAGRAFQAPVGASQREAAQGMLEIGVLPELLFVTLPALWQRPLMGVVLLVAELTLQAHATEPAIVLVAFLALQRKMHTREREVFVKVLGQFPTLVHVALLATHTEVTLVGILVTGRAFCGDRLKENVLRPRYGLVAL